MAHTPMGGGNTSTDMVTGLPDFEMQKARAYEAAQDQVIKSEAAHKELYGAEGKIILEFALNLLENKIEKFVAGDPECATILNLLTELHYTANIGRTQAIKRIRNIFGEHTPDWVNRLA